MSVSKNDVKSMPMRGFTGRWQQAFQSGSLNLLDRQIARLEPVHVRVWHFNEEDRLCRILELGCFSPHGSRPSCVETDDGQVVRVCWCGMLGTLIATNRNLCELHVRRPVPWLVEFQLL